MGMVGSPTSTVHSGFMSLKGPGASPLASTRASLDTRGGMGFMPGGLAVGGMSPGGVAMGGMPGGIATGGGMSAGGVAMGGMTPAGMGGASRVNVMALSSLYSPTPAAAVPAAASRTNVMGVMPGAGLVGGGLANVAGVCVTPSSTFGSPMAYPFAAGANGAGGGFMAMPVAACGSPACNPMMGGMGAPIGGVAALGGGGAAAGAMSVMCSPGVPMAAPAAASASGELVQMLAEEVLRLRKQLEEKKAKGAAAATAVAAAVV